MNKYKENKRKSYNGEEKELKKWLILDSNIWKVLQEALIWRNKRKRVLKSFLEVIHFISKDVCRSL